MTPRRRRLLWAAGAALWGLSAGRAWSQGPAAARALELNTASQAELETLPGVGPGLSEAILAARQRGGPFEGWRSFIQRVKGLGPAKARQLSAAGLRVAGLAYPG